MASKLTSRGLVFLSAVILTRFLDPADFGIVSLSLIYIGFVNLFVDAGFGQAIIQKNRITSLELTSCFWLLMVGGFAAYLLTYLCVPIASTLLKAQGIRKVIVVQGFIFFAVPFKVVTSAVLSRDLRIDLQAKVDVFWMVAKLVLSILMAVIGCGIWSIIIPTVAAEFATAFTLMVLCRWRPSFQFSYAAIKSLVTFGTDLTGSRVVWYLNTRADQFVIGRFLGAGSLGVYSMAQNVTNAVLQFATSFSQLAYPLLSKLQHDGVQLRATFQKVNRLTYDFYAPILVGTALVSSEIVSTFFNAKWSGMVFPLQVLCVVLLFRLNETNAGLLINAVGRSRVNLYLNCISSALMIPAMYVGCRYYGMKGMLFGLCLTSIPLTFVTTVACCKVVGMSVGEYYSNILATMKATMLMAVAVVVAKQLLHGTGQQLRLVVMVACGTIAYVASLYFLDPKKWNEITEVIGIRKQVSTGA